MNPPADANRQNLIRVLRALDEAAAKLAGLERARNEPIAIIGLGCRFPGGVRDAADYWRLLRAGADATGEVPADRWDADLFYDPDPDTPGKICTRRGAFLDEVDRFDAAHFGLSPREAAAMDPQQRLLLEVAHEALDGAGLLGDRLADNATGVFVGLTNNDYGQLLKAAAADRPLDAYYVTGNALNAAAGRIAYLLGLRGPALTVDSACSSSLVTVHLACQALRTGDCSLALAGGANLILAPDASVALSRARMLAPDGRCKTFDAAADGYARGEGCGMVVLKRLSDAQRDGNRVLAVIRASAVNQDGPSSGFTVPSGAAQRRLLRTALAAAKLGPADIDYVEAHGTGTALGDPIEVNALAAEYGGARPPERPLLLGSVKTNIGHLESAAGVAGLIKTVLALWHRELPAHLHFRRPSPHIPWSDLPVSVVAAARPWPETGRPRRAGVSSFGVSGTNAHVILEEAPAGLAAAELPQPRLRFRGERHWAPPPPAAADERDWFYHVAWRERSRRSRERTSVAFAAPERAARDLRAWLEDGGNQPAARAYGECLPVLERAAAEYARRAVQALGDAAVREVAGPHRRLFARLLTLAAGAKGEDPAALLADLRATVPEAAAEAEMLARCGERLPDVLRGRIDPLTLLFSAEGGVTAVSLYHDTPAARAANALVQAALAVTLPAGRPLRVLEIGAGTGGTTAAVLPALPAEGAEYVFTDVSPLFVAQARERYRDRPWIRVQVLDIERDPLTQGLAPGEFDLIIAANVLHATRDLRETLRHARGLLAGGGVLLLLEATEPAAFLDLIFGLTEGWWRFTDTDLRPAHALLPAGRWSEALTATGFTAAEAYTYPRAGGAIYASQSVLLARAQGPTDLRRPPAGPWLALAGNDEALNAALADGLNAAGGHCEWVHPGEELAARLAARDDWRGVIHAAAVGIGDPLAAGPLDGARRLAQALAGRALPVCFLTAGAVAVQPEDRVDGLAGAGLWGFARTLALEHPELKPVLIDVDDASGATAAVADLVDSEGETQIAWRGDRRFVARLARGSGPVPVTTGAGRVGPDATYLIIGGLGGLGVPLARWLVERGARHVVLGGRSAPDADASDAIAVLNAGGADVRTVRLDVSSPSDVERVLAEIASTPWPLRGVVHAAGVLDDGVVRQQTAEKFARVLAPKVAGAWHLHRLTAGLELDWFVLFSSATALLGSPGQANHAAANAFEDALAHHRRARGLPALSINWGPWAEIGAAARRDFGARARTQGIGSIAPAKGWRAWARALTGMPVQVALIPVTWTEVPASLAEAPFFSEVRPAAPAAATPVASGAEDWAALPPARRLERLRTEVRTQIAQVLGLNGPAQVDPVQGLFALGMDSLTAIELRNRLQALVGRPLPSTLAFDHPTADKLAAYLAGPDAPVATAVSVAEPAAASAASSAPAPVGQEIAVVGLALRMPGAGTPEQLWELLRAGVDAITEVPSERWDIDAYHDPDPAAPGKMSTRFGGFVSGADQFDAAFFGVSPREAEHMDPQHRLLLETSWEALERAGIAADALAGTPTGVFVGISNQDYTQLLAARGLEAIDPYVGSGNAHSVAAGRLSYTLGLQGPSLAVDTACSSSLVAVHLAVQSLRAGECELALAGGVNLLLSPLISVNHSRARMLAPDGRCKTFDAAADGFIRSEGCGIVVLKPLAAARRDGDRVLAVIRGSAVNQDGRTSGLTVPSGPAQQAVMRAALRQAGVAPEAVDYVEAHGTGTALGDPIELNALQAVYGAGRPKDRPLRVGSLKTNLGHLESAAGVAGLIKAVLALHHGEIPPHLHFRQPNPLVPWAEFALEVPVRTLAWPRRADGAPRFAGVSSFGFGGTNAHIVLADEPAEASAGASVAPSSSSAPALPLLLSARTETALAALAGRYAERLASGNDVWADVCRTAATGRAAFAHRLAVFADDAGAAGAVLARVARGEAPPEIVAGRVGESPRVAFLFSGQGSLYAGAGRELFAANPTARAALAECRAIVQARAGWDVAVALESEEKLARTEFGQVALFVLEYALARTWLAWGVKPAIVLGHSVGEYAAACVAGVLSLDAALGLLIERARLMGALPEDGAMLAVAAGEGEVADVLARHGLELGAVNSPRQVVLTGARAAVAAAEADCRARGLRAQPLAVRQAYHSRHMEPMLEAFARAAEATSFGAAHQADFVSTVSGRVAGGELGTPAYWTEQIRRPVRFGAAVAAAREAGADLVIEVGPRGILVALAQQTWSGAEPGRWLTSLQPGRPELAHLRENAARAWVQGAPVAWREVTAGERGRRADLPTYPFQRRSYWFEARQPAVVSASAAPAPAYELGWELRSRTTGGTDVSGSWCVLGAAGAALREELQRRGARMVDTPEAADRGVVWVPGVGEPLLPTLPQLARSSGRCWLVTRRAVAVNAGEGARVEPDAAPAWYAAKSAALERPQGSFVRIDWDETVAPAALVDELLAGGVEEEIALRTEGRWVARLRPRAAAHGVFRPRTDGAYLITGGLGALGLRVARWLVERGAKHLLLLGRRPPSPTVAAELQRWRDRGVAVTVRAVDVAEREALAAVVRECTPALRGVFHAAGVAGYESLATLTPAQVQAVLRPKVEGARWLDALTADRPLDVFVLFSSVAAVWGSKGQAHYAAANGWLDALAQRRRGEGRPALSVAWGPWAGGGLATAEAAALLESSGLRLMAPVAALVALESALVDGPAQVVVAEVDWTRFRETYEMRGPRPLLEHLPAGTGLGTDASTGAAAAPTAGLAAELRALPAEERLERLRRQVQTVLARILKLPGDEQPDLRAGFAGLGVDSLMAVDLRNRLAAELGVSLAATVAFDFPDVERLSRHLLAKLEPVAASASTTPAAPTVATPASSAPRATDIEALSDAEVEALLLKKLDRL